MKVISGTLRGRNIKGYTERHKLENFNGAIA